MEPAADTASRDAPFSRLEQHPTVVRFRERQALVGQPEARQPLEADWLRQLCLDAGADNVGFVEMARPEIADQGDDILAVFPYAACPTGAIGADGHFDFSACYTHNYREFMGGFGDWVEQIADSGSARQYRKRVANFETASMWQSLSFGANYKAAYCMAVCPAGEDVIAPLLATRKQYLDDVVRPLQHRRETVYVVPGSDAEAYVERRFPHKRIRRVGNGLRPQSIEGFVGGLPVAFQRGRSRGLDATYHFTFTGGEDRHVTVVIRDRTLTVEEGHVGAADLRVMADSHTWLDMLAGDANLAWALLRRRIRLRGSPRLLRAFARCFPS